MILLFCGLLLLHNCNNINYRIRETKYQVRRNVYHRSPPVNSFKLLMQVRYNYGNRGFEMNFHFIQNL